MDDGLPQFHYENFRPEMQQNVCFGGEELEFTYGDVFLKRQQVYFRGWA